MHGTGTSLGDPIEVGAATAVLCPASKGGNFRDTLVLEAAKSRIGHCETGAGIIGITTAISRAGAVVVSPLRHLRTPNPHVNAVLDRLGDRDLGACGSSTVAMHRQSMFRAVFSNDTEQGVSAQGMTSGVSGFAFQGTNAHALVHPPESARQVGTGDGMALRTWDRQRYWFAPPYHPMTEAAMKHQGGTFQMSIKLVTTVNKSPVLSELSDHVISGNAILPGAAHAEFGRAAAAQLVTFAEFDVGVRDMVFSAPLHLQPDHAMQCVVDAGGRITVGTSIQTHQGRSSFGVRSTGNVTAIVGYAPSLSENYRLSRHNVIGRTRSIKKSGSPLLCRVQMSSGASTPYHVSPRMLDAVFQSSTALTSLGSRSAHCHASTQTN